MAVRLNITIDEELYRRLKEELPPKGISAFIGAAVKAKLAPDRKALDAAYKAASRERWRRELSRDWEATEGEGWPD
jgi:Arc/MetJ family transcription regulator